MGLHSLSVTWNIFVYGIIHLLEAMGVFVIVISSFRAFVDYCTTKESARLHFNRLRLAEGLASGLEFKLAGEILRTVVVQSLDEILIVGGIIALRAFMAFMIFWEIRHETARLQ